MTTRKQQQEEIEQTLQAYHDRETSFALNGFFRIVALIVMLIAAIILGTPTP